MSRLNDPRLHVRFNVVALGVIVILGVPTVLWWRDSVTWIVVMSWWALVSAHLAALMGAKAEEKADKEA